MKTLLTLLFAAGLVIPSLAQSKKISQFQNTNTLGGGDYLLTERADGLTNNNIRWSQIKAQLTNEALTGFQPASEPLTNLSATVTIRTNGNVGIGTNAPSAKLSVFSTSGTVFDVNSGVLAVTNGRVGIGTSTPRDELEVIGGISVSDVTDQRITMEYASGSGRITTTASGGWLLSSIHSGQPPIVFRTGTNSTPPERMRIHGTGQVGIATNSPQYPLHVHGDTYTPSNSYAGNFIWNTPRWLDQKFSGLGFGLGVNVPARTQIYGGVFGRAFAVNDDGDFSIQFQHGLAPTNALFPQLYYQPHIHISVASIGAGESNCTFIMEYQIAPVGSNYAASLIISNTLALTATNTHYVLSLGNITNNFLQAKDSVVARGNLKRIAAPTGDLSAKVFLDSLDFHIPVNEYGSGTIIGD